MQSTLWEYRYAQRTQNMQGSAIRELLKMIDNPDIISFGGGLPAPEVFPVEAFKSASTHVLEKYSSQALQYSSTEGYLPLRELIVRHTERYGINITPDNILITSGSQQALDLLGKVFINRGDRILVESPTYLGALQAWAAYNADYVSVDIDLDGMIVDQIKEAFRAGPKFIYIQPNFHNPAGVTLSLPRREQLVEQATQQGIPIIEDDPYGQLRYEGPHIPPIVSLDSKYRGGCVPYSGNVIYLSTFSKVLAPGLRLGSIIAPQEVIQKLVTAKQGTDLHTSTYNQILAYEVSKGGFIDKHVKIIREIYSERRDVMLSSLRKHMPAGIEWTHPQGGLFLWVTLPSKVDTTKVFHHAIENYRVAYVPGSAFFPDGSGKNTMRLNFSSTQPDGIREGISRLGEFVKNILA